jgi:hypothetical protein
LVDENVGEGILGNALDTALDHGTNKGKEGASNHTPASALQLQVYMEPPSKVEPIFYVHVPKAGSSFATSILHLACGDEVNEDVTVRNPSDFSDVVSSCGSRHISRFWGGHHPLPKSFLEDDEQLSKVVVMIRPARQRIISGYFNNLHDCFPLQYKLRVDENGLPWKNARHRHIDPSILMKYAKCTERCAVNMLSGRQCSAKGSHEDLPRAVSRLPKLGFVGLTNHWELTVCLWHAKFGGKCLPAEFKNLRPGSHTHGGTYNESSFESSFRPADDTIYEAAAELFAKEMVQYGVNPRSCAEIHCPRVAHLFGNSNSTDLSSVSRFEYDSFDGNALEKLTWPGRATYDED